MLFRIHMYFLTISCLLFSSKYKLLRLSIGDIYDHLSHPNLSLKTQLFHSSKQDQAYISCMGTIANQCLLSGDNTHTQPKVPQSVFCPLTIRFSLKRGFKLKEGNALSSNLTFCEAKAGILTFIRQSHVSPNVIGEQRLDMWLFCS